MPVLMLYRKRSLGATLHDSVAGTVIAAIQKRMNSDNPESPCVNAKLRSQDLKSLFGLITCGRGSLGKRAKRVFFERAPKGVAILDSGLRVVHVENGVRAMHERVHTNDGCKSQKKKIRVTFYRRNEKPCLLGSCSQRTKFVLPFAGVLRRRKSAVVDCVLYSSGSVALRARHVDGAPQTLQLRPVGEQQRMFPRLRQHQRQGSARRVSGSRIATRNECLFPVL